mmetsp:Transcript_41404/g.67171  ORF Transcript_41404/g.67171 Transcript_41404/m.67171 type:complete len:1140 (+) Transcript_41404:77-3496(+)
MIFGGPGSRKRLLFVWLPVLSMGLLLFALTPLSNERKVHDGSPSTTLAAFGAISNSKPSNHEEDMRDIINRVPPFFKRKPARRRIEGLGSSVRNSESSSGVFSISPALNVSIGFNGLGQEANSDGSQFNPPDQALLVGKTVIVHAVNTAIGYYDKAGQRLFGPLSLYTFFGADTTMVLTDPVGLYDASVERYFVVAALYSGTKGSAIQDSQLYVAVSRTVDPRDGWFVSHYSSVFTITPHYVRIGYPSDNPGWADFPQIGVSAHGLFITVNNFQSYPPANFINVLVYALPKLRLISNDVRFLEPTILDLTRNAPPSTDFGPFSVQPARSAPLQPFWSKNGGAMFFAARSVSDSEKIWIWVLTGTATLQSSSFPNLEISASFVLVEGTPSRTGLTTRVSQRLTDVQSRSCVDARATYTQITGDDGRMKQVMWRSNYLYGAWNVNRYGGVGDRAVQWAKIRFSLSDMGQISGNTARTGFVEIPDGSLLYPAIAVRRDGRGIMAMSVISTSLYPSVAYVPFNSNGPDSSFLYIAAQGSNPFLSIQNSTRWGDYSGIEVDPVSGGIWASIEYIPPRDPANCPKAPLAWNWGSYIFQIDMPPYSNTSDDVDLVYTFPTPPTPAPDAPGGGGGTVSGSSSGLGQSMLLTIVGVVVAVVVISALSVWGILICQRRARRHRALAEAPTIPPSTSGDGYAFASVRGSREDTPPDRDTFFYQTPPATAAAAAGGGGGRKTAPPKRRSSSRDRDSHGAHAKPHPPRRPSVVSSSDDSPTPPPYLQVPMGMVAAPPTLGKADDQQYSAGKDNSISYEARYARLTSPSKNDSAAPPEMQYHRSASLPGNDSNHAPQEVQYTRSSSLPGNDPSALLRGKSSVVLHSARPQRPVVSDDWWDLPDSSDKLPRPLLPLPSKTTERRPPSAVLVSQRPLPRPTPTVRQEPSAFRPPPMTIRALGMVGIDLDRKPNTSILIMLRKGLPGKHDIMQRSLAPANSEGAMASVRRSSVASVGSSAPSEGQPTQRKLPGMLNPPVHPRLSSAHRVPRGGRRTSAQQMIILYRRSMRNTGKVGWDADRRPHLPRPPIPPKVDIQAKSLAPEGLLNMDVQPQTTRRGSTEATERSRGAVDVVAWWERDPGVTRTPAELMSWFRT